MTQQTSSLLSAQSMLPTSDLKLYARLIWRWSWLIVLCALVAAGAAYYVSINMTPIYQSTSRLMISQGQSPDTGNYTDILASERIARTYAELMKSNVTLQQSLQRLGLDAQLEDVAAQITAVNVTPVRDTQLVNLTVEGLNPELVAAVANTLPQLFLEELRQVQSSRFTESKASLQEQLDAIAREIEATQLDMDALQDARTAQDQLEYGRLRNELTQYQASYANLLQTYETLRLTEAQSMDNVVIMEPAKVPEAPIRPRTMMNVLLAAIVGAMLALGVIFLIEYLDDRIRTPDDVKRVTTLPVLGLISRVSRKDLGKHEQLELLSAAAPRHPTVEAFRRLRTNLQYYNVDEGMHSLLIASARPGAGKSTTAVNLAIVLAQSGKKVALIDSDMRKPRLHKIFNLPRKPGLSEVLASGMPAESSLVPVGPVRAPGVTNLRVLVSGGKAPNAAELLGSKRMQELVAYLKREADVVIFDSPPLLAVADAQVIGQWVEGVLLVANTQQTSSGDLQQGIELLEQVNAPLLGVVLNQFTKTGQGYYYYTYDYYYADDDQDDLDDVPSGPAPFPPRPATKSVHTG